MSLDKPNCFITDDYEFASRNWFLTINEGAECFNDIELILSGLSKCDYAYIYHDLYNETEDLGSIQSDYIDLINSFHIHLVLKFSSARKFKTIQNTFKGAHIEVARNLTSCLRYLCHLDSPNKFQYDVSDVFQKNDLFSRYVENKIQLNTDNLLSYINLGYVCCYFDLIHYFGISQVHRYRLTIMDILVSLGWTGDTLGKMVAPNYDSNIISIIDRKNNEIESLKHQIDELSDTLNSEGFV